MKRLIVFLMLLAVAVISIAADRDLRIQTGYTMPNPFTLGASDTINEDDTVTFSITNLQKYAQMQYFTIGLTDVSGTPNVAITAYGKVTSTSAWVQIGSPITWTSDSNDGTISSTSPINYNYLKVVFIATSTNQQTLINVFEVKTSNAFDIPANSGTLTIARATSGAVTVTTKDDDANAATTYRAGGTGALTIGSTSGTTAILGSSVNVNVSSNYATNIGTGTTNAAVTIGGGSNTFAVNSTALDISTAGAISGATTIANSGTITTTTDGDNVIIDAGTDLHAIDVQINSASKFSADTIGNVVAAGYVTATGGLNLATEPTVYWPAGGAVTAAASGTDVACANGNRFWVELNIPYNSTITGLAYLVGSTGGTDSVVVQLCNSAGVEVATSRAPGTAAAIVGTTAQFQSVPFTAPYAATAGRYFAVVQFNGTTAKFRAYAIPGSKFIANTAAGTWGTKADITPGTTFVADKGPILMTY